MRAASCMLAVPMLARAFPIDRLALVQCWMLKICVRNGLSDDVLEFFLRCAGKGWRLPAQMVSSRGRRAKKGSWHVEKVRPVALGAAAFLRWPSSQ